MRAERGEDVSRFFTNKGKKTYPIQRVDVDSTIPILKESNQAVRKAN